MASSIVDLPKDILVTILGEVASEPSKFSCKKFLEVAEDDYVSKDIILGLIMSIRYRCDGLGLEAQLKAKAFLDVCEDARNLQAIDHKGMKLFIGYDDDTIVDKVEGTKLITKALLLGYKGAKIFYNFAIVDTSQISSWGCICICIFEVFNGVFNLDNDV